MHVFNSSTTLGDLVLDHPAAADLFERLGLDFCCGGAKTLGDAVKERGLDAATVLVMLKSLGESPLQVVAGGHDVAGMTLAELVDHIVADHHEPLRVDFVKIGELFDTVVRVHGAIDPSLAEMRDRFVTIREELLAHMAQEENNLFPVCRDAGTRAATRVGDDLLRELEHTHEATGGVLAELRELGGDYATDDAHCGTHRLLLQLLAAMEADLHQHIHEENNLLFPRARELMLVRA
ncbi:MAG: DUF542 domain-containing protein [Thermoleophilia bacterium]|nr:DUF542 domain-containing protein [Thermoleophilia bacterium]